MRTASVAVTCSAVAGLLWAPLALAQQKTVRACEAEWQANKAIFQPKGITEQEYVDECRSFRTAPPATSAVKHAPDRARPTAAPAQAPARRPKRTATPAPARPGKIPTGAQARFAVVTANVNLRSGPNTNSEIITTTPAGSRVQVTNCTGEWCMVTWNERSGFAIARNLDTGGARQARRYRAPSGYAGPRPGYPYGPPVVYGPPVYYPPPAIVYAPGYYFGARYYGWHRRR